MQIGWAPPSRDALRARLLKEGFKPLQLVISGLVSRRDDGGEIDRFRNRLMIPIARDTGTVVAFGGRALEADHRTCNAECEMNPSPRHSKCGRSSITWPITCNARALPSQGTTRAYWFSISHRPSLSCTSNW